MALGTMVDASHNTATASKATGQKYGTAKQATLVAVKMRDRNLNEACEMYDLIAQDIEAKNRQNDDLRAAKV